MKNFSYTPSIWLSISGPILLLIAGILILVLTNDLYWVGGGVFLLGLIGIIHGCISKKHEIFLDGDELCLDGEVLKTVDIEKILRIDYNESIYYEFKLKDGLERTFKAPFLPNREAELWTYLQSLNKE